MSESSPIGVSATASRMLTNWVRLLRLVLSEKKGLVVILSILTVCIALFPFIQSGAEALFINELARGAAVKTFPPLLLYAMVAVIASLIIRPLTNTLNDYLTKLLWFYNDEKLTVALLKKRGELDVGTLEHPKYQDLLNKINEGGVWRVQNTTERLFIIFQQLIEFAIASVALFLAKWWLLPVVLASVVPELMTQLVYARQVWEISGDKAEVRRRYWELRSHFENKPALIEIKLFQSVSYLLQSIRSLFRDFHAAQLKLDVKQYRLQFITQTIANAALAAATVAFALDVVSGKTQIGTFTFLLAVTHRFRGSLSWLFRTIGHQYEDNLFVSDIFAFLDTPRALPRPERGYIVKATRVPEIVFDRVTFSYPDSSSPALSDFSLTVRPGEKLAVVGANGSGKTTFVKLLCRFYDPTSGNILVDGRRLPSVSLDSWYRVLGVLFQQYAHYHFTVKETIAMGRSDAPLDLARVRSAAHSSEAHDFIAAWKKEYEQMLGREFTEGVEPSIGQWQKLALARTFYRQPLVMVLDEPTASIDAEAEEKIFEHLQRLPGRRTMILVSHRFSTVRHADRIIVLDGGKLIESGTHEKLISLDGMYAHLFNLQARGYR